MKKKINDYIVSDSKDPLFIVGDVLDVLKYIPDNSIDCCITSPPYWGKRMYEEGGIGQEEDYKKYIEIILKITSEIYRIIKPSGSFWFNVGDSYLEKQLINIPYRIAIEMADRQKWILRNTIIWNKVKGGLDNTKDRLGNIHEPVFHFVKCKKGYYYDVDAIRNTPKKASIDNGAVISATGVTGVRYRRQIELSEDLTSQQKENALKALNEMLEDMKKGVVSDFRMIIKGKQRVIHSNSVNLSGRAKELQQKGFYFLKYNPKGSKPGDVWDIIPEDTQGRDIHFAAYPADLCKIHIAATCPIDGIVFDPFCGTGTTNLVAKNFKRKSIGIDISEKYIKLAEERCKNE